MHAVAGMFLALFSGLAGFFAKWVAQKTAFAAAAIGTFGILTVGLYAVLSGLLAGLMATFPASGGVVATLVWAVTPPQLPAGIAAVISAETAITLYRWNVENLRLAAYVT